MNACSCISDSISNAWSDCEQSYFAAKEKVYTNLTSAATVVKDGAYLLGSSLKNGVCHIASPFVETAARLVRYIKQYWTTILALGIAWGIIVAGIGAMYGFNATALPFTIGISIGFGVGLMTGLLTVKVLDPKNQHVNEEGWAYNTLWDLINAGLYQLDPNGTRMILLSVVVTVLLWAASYLPTPIGLLFGLLMGNKLATGAGFYGANPPILPPYEYHPPEDRIKKLEVLQGISNATDPLHHSHQPSIEDRIQAIEQRLSALT